MLTKIVSDVIIRIIKIMLWYGAGHSCWGILEAPATGKVMAQLILDGHASLLDIAPFSPARFN